MEMLGALALAIGGVALATMSEDQLKALRPPRRERSSEPGTAEATATTATAASADTARAEAKGHLARRPRARQRG
jgi:hypothetical protein